jgi:hypothetical protein
MYRPTFAFDAVGRDSDVAVEIGMNIMREAVEFLAVVDMIYLQKLPGQFPPLYQAGIRYGDDKPEPGTACGDDDWRDIAVLYKKGVGDCEELAAARIAELRFTRGIRANPAILLQSERPTPGRKGSHLFHIMVRWPDGLPTGAYDSTVRWRRYVTPDSPNGMMLECPSEVLGMRPAFLMGTAA